MKFLNGWCIYRSRSLLTFAKKLLKDGSDLVEAQAVSCKKSDTEPAVAYGLLSMENGMKGINYMVTGLQKKLLNKFSQLHGN
jgi:hypothetical protein